MPIYAYFCADNGETVEVAHSMKIDLSTWGQVCELAARPLGDERIAHRVHPVRQVAAMADVAQALGAKDRTVDAGAARRAREQAVQSLLVDVAPELLAGEGPLGDRRPSADDEADIDMAFQVVRALGRLDVGQAAVVARGHVLAVEAAEGTDAMLVRCAELRALGKAPRAPSGVLAKAPKPGQEQRVDLPTIGPDTVGKAAAAGVAGIAVAAGQVLMADRDATIAEADRHGLFLVGKSWSEDAGA